MKQLQEKQAALEKDVSVLKQRLETELKVQYDPILLSHRLTTRFLFLCLMI